MGAIVAEAADRNAEPGPWRDFARHAIPGRFVKPWFLLLVGARYQLEDGPPRTLRAARRQRVNGDA